MKSFSPVALALMAAFGMAAAADPSASECAVSLYYPYRLLQAEN